MTINMLRDVDDNVGFYAAGTPSAGSATGWACTLYQSIDNGATYVDIGPLPNPATMGVVIGTLGPHVGRGKEVDETNSMTVKLHYGTLSSVTYSNFLNGMQMAVVGNEILLFREATLVGDMTYTLRGFLRGYRGSESQIGIHGPNERFILANPSTIKRVTGTTADIGRTSLFKAVNSGQTRDVVPTMSFTFDGRELMPYAACHLAGGRIPSGDLILQWVRRNRTSGEWRSLVDVPMTEQTEAYEVDIFSDNTYATVKRTLKSTTPTVTYSATDQNTDFGATQSTVYFTVYQMSAIVGRGYPASASA